MTGQRLGKCIAFCLLPWSCLSFSWSDAAGPGTISPGAGHIRKGLPRDVANRTYVHSNISAPCTALPPPRYGYYYVDRGSGISLGSVLVYWCQEGYQLVGSERLSCLRRESASSWSHPPPHCQAAPQPSGTGSRAAVAASLLSGAVILALSVSFAVCCWRDRARRSRGGSPENLPKLPLQSWHPDAQVLPQLVLQPSTPPIAALPRQPHRKPHDAVLPAMPCHADLPRDLLPLHYRSYEEHKLFNKFGRPV
ncbi:sushi domain-containing protein 3-like [Theristicus caerulescens]